jgi:hypothetical protein
MIYLGYDHGIVNMEMVLLMMVITLFGLRAEIEWDFLYVIW